MGIFKNLNLSEKLKIFKKSGKDVYCAKCGTRTGIITRQWLLDDKCLCVNCQNVIPAYFQRNYGSLSFETYNVIASYMTGESKELGKQFKKKHTFSDLQLDAVNGILRYKTSNANPLYVKLENISDFYLEYNPNFIQNDTGSITMSLECINPYIVIQEKLMSTGSEYVCKYIKIFNETKNGTCRICGRQNATLTLCEIKNEVGKRNIFICENCIHKFNSK